MSGILVAFLIAGNNIVAVSNDGSFSGSPLSDVAFGG
jgi:hypothetical protein